MARAKKPGIGMAAIAVVILLTNIPPLFLLLIAFAILGGIAIYSFDTSKKKDSIAEKPQVLRKPLQVPVRIAKPPPPPPPHLQQTKSSTHQKTSAIDEATDGREVEPIQPEPLIGSNPLHVDPFPVEKPAAKEPPASQRSGQQVPPKAEAPVPQASPKDDIDDPVSVLRDEPSASATFRVPRTPHNYGRGRWIPCGESITIGNTSIPGGMIYVGNSLKGDLGIDDPCLINPTKPVAQHGDYTERQMGYSPSYTDISSTARRAYLNWLSDGRRDPDADIGFVFLFFYGLERRALVDSLSDELAKADLPIIATELRRLLSVYGGKSNSFNSYASQFLDWILLPSYTPRLYEKPLPDLKRASHLPLHIRLALGQAAMDGKPVPSRLALGWAKLDPNITLRSPASRCPEEFDQLFMLKYSEFFNQGMTLPRNKTKLKVVYRPASAGFRVRDPLTKVLDDIPDVTVLTAPIKKLESVIEAALKDLDPFSRLIAKNPGARDTCEGLLRLPLPLWPESSLKRLMQLKESVGEGMKSMKFEDALYSLFEEAEPSKDAIVHLTRILEAICIGIEPNVNLGAKPLKPDDQIVLFAMPCSEVPTRTDGPFLVAELTLQLASAVAAADGDFSFGEAAYLREQVNSWGHLSQGQKHRLLAHIEFLTYTPASIKQLKKKIESLATDDREMIAESMARVAHVDGYVSPDAVRILERTYKVLGVNTSKVFSHLHVAASGSEASNLQVTGTAEQEGRFSLNRDRIAVRQADTEKVQVLLANIFDDSDASEAELVEDAPPSEPPLIGATEGMLLGLDLAHSTLTRRMLARQEWSREELLQMAAELDLMLDGALEHINDAAFDAFDMPLIESDDPVVLNTEIRGMLCL